MKIPPVQRTRICTSIAAPDTATLKEGVEEAFSHGSDYVEVRFDYIDKFDIDGLKKALESYVDRCIYTCRRTEEGGRFQAGEEERLRVLKELAKQGPAYLDVELSTMQENPELAGSLRSMGSKLIVSWHNFSETPDQEALKPIYKMASGFGDVVKIVPFAKSFKDNTSILSLYQFAEKGRLIAFCMGELGVVSRVLCGLMGSPFTYASLNDRQTAPGQISIKELKEFYASL